MIKCRTPMHSTKASSPTWIFVDSDFQTSCLRESWCKALGFPTYKTLKQSRKFLTPPGNKYATCLFRRPLSMMRILATYHSKIFSFGTWTYPLVTIPFPLQSFELRNGSLRKIWWPSLD
jgi:hypothetical protein